MNFTTYFLLYLLIFTISFNDATVRKTFARSMAWARIRSALITTCGVISICTPYYSIASEPPKVGECLTKSNPQATTQICRQLGLTSDGRLRGCNANENCFSTSAKAATKRSKPWHFSQPPEEAFATLKTAMELEGLSILKSNPKSLYVLGSQSSVPKQPPGSTLFYEFLLRPADKIVLYRAVVDKTVFVYPLQQPISDFGVLTSQLGKILARSSFTQENEDETI